MIQDVEVGRKTEVEIFSGNVNDLGRQLGIPMPVKTNRYSKKSVSTFVKYRFYGEFSVHSHNALVSARA
jgi:hypothetical protein